MTQSPSEWAAEWSAQIGRNIARLRRERGVKSTQELSDRCAAIGYPIPRNTIANIETGRKSLVPVQEVVAIARALGVPPITVLYHVSEPPLHVLPDDLRLPIEGAEWFAGNQPLVDPPGLLEKGGSYYGARAPEWAVHRVGLHLYRRYLFAIDTLMHRIRDVEDAQAELAAAEAQPEPEDGDVDVLGLPVASAETWRRRLAHYIEERNSARDNVARLAQQLRNIGAMPTELPAVALDPSDG